MESYTLSFLSFDGHLLLSLSLYLCCLFYCLLFEGAAQLLHGDLTSLTQRVLYIHVFDLRPWRYVRSVVYGSLH